MENLILLHKLDVKGQTATKVKQMIAQYVAQTKETFIGIKGLKVTNLYLPNKEGISDVKVLYPLPNIISNDPENIHKMNEVIDAINDLVNNRDKVIIDD